MAPSQATYPTAMIGPDTKLKLTNVSDHSESDVRFEVDLLDDLPDAPPVIEFRLTNVGPTRQFFFGAMPPFTAVQSESAALSLIPEGHADYITPVDPNGPTHPDEFVPESREDECWRALEALLVVDIGKSIRLDPDETLSVHYRVLVSADPDVACSPKGPHRVTNRFSIGGIHEDVNEASVTLRVG